MTALSLWENVDPPSPSIDAFTDAQINLGTAFICSSDVTVKAIRYYRLASSPYTAEPNRPEAVGVYRIDDGHLMVSTSTVPAIVNGWNEAPIAITALSAGVYYMAVVFYSGRGTNPNFSAKGGYFNGFSIINGVLSAPATGQPDTPNNGQYGYGSALAMPTSTFNGGCYFIDPVVETAGSPPPPTSRPADVMLI